MHWADTNMSLRREEFEDGPENVRGKSGEHTEQQLGKTKQISGL